MPCGRGLAVAGFASDESSGRWRQRLSTQYSVLGTWSFIRGTRCSLLIGALVSAIVLLVNPGSFAHADGSDPSTFAARLSAIAAKCDELGLAPQAEVTRGWIIVRHPGRQYLFLPSVNDPAAPKAGATENVKHWRHNFIAARREQAAALFAKAQAASQGGQPARAYQLLFEVLREDPDHAEARRVLGFHKTTAGQWTLPEADKIAARPGAFNHPKLGWPARSYWVVESPHFSIVTNHSPREGLEAAQQLENLDALWRQIFFRYWSSPAALAARLAGGNEPLAPPRPKMQVVLFKDKQQYAAHVAAAHPKAASTLGLYSDQERMSYFYGGDTAVYRTWYHEAAHQLFQEALAGTVAEPGAQRDFWALEGAALYLESLAAHAGYWTAGGCEANRLQFARYRVLTGDLDLPLARLSAMSRTEVQEAGDIGKLYTQAAGLTHFLMDGAGGKYRDAFVDLLATIYRGSDTRQTLATETGQSLSDLDQQYRGYLIVTDDDLAGIPDVAALRNLSLCRGQISDSGLARLAGCKNLEWLDLSYTPATDLGLESFAAAAGLKQLFLEGTQVTEAALPLVARFRQLELLDLSRLPIRDAALAHLAPLRNLKRLYLTGCPISDTGLAPLRGLKQLEELDRGGTQITDEGFAKLRAVLPKLK